MSSRLAASWFASWSAPLRIGRFRPGFASLRPETRLCDADAASSHVSPRGPGSDTGVPLGPPLRADKNCSGRASLGLVRAKLDFRASLAAGRHHILDAQRRDFSHLHSRPSARHRSTTVTGRVGITAHMLARPLHDCSLKTGACFIAVSCGSQKGRHAPVF